MWADKVRYGFAGFRSTASPDRIAKSPVVDIAHARFRKNDCRVPQEKFRVQDSSEFSACADVHYFMHMRANTDRKT